MDMDPPQIGHKEAELNQAKPIPPRNQANRELCNLSDPGVISI